MEPHVKKEPFSLVYAAGGVKGRAHPGVRKAINEAGLVVEEIIGASVGGLVAAFDANGYEPDRLNEIMRTELHNRNNPAVWLKAFGKMPDPMQFLAGGALPNLVEPMKETVARYGLKPRPGLKIVAYNMTKRKPHVFAGTDYDMAAALAATCSLPGMFRPVRVDDGYLIDIGVYNRCPTAFCQHRPILSKLGFASEMPQDPLPPWEMYEHFREVIGFTQFYNNEDSMDRFPDAIVIQTETPRLSALAFSSSDETLEGVRAAGYRAAKAALAAAGFTTA